MGIDRQLQYAALFGGARVPAPPASGVAIVTCMDSRIDPPVVLGLDPGDANIIRNAGGLVDDGVIRSLVLSQRYLATREVLIIQHLGCSLIGLDDEEFADDIERRVGARPRWAAGGFDDVEASVRRAMARVRESPYLLHTDAVRGAVLDLVGGGAHEVV